MKTIKIKNFQSHKATQLNLHPNVNVIVGQSSSGKTAIFRAIEWLNTNRPLGTRFITHGEKEAKVDIDDVQGVKTSNGKSSYCVGNDSFSAGSNVPDLVSKSLNLSELNIQNQLDEHFLITSSPGEVARTFNRILNIEKVDEYTSRLTRQINTTNTIIEEKTERIESLTNKIKGLEYLDEMQKEVSFLDDRIKLATKVKTGIEKLSQVISTVRDLEIKLYKDAVTSQKVSEMLKEFKEPIEELKRLESLQILVKQISELRNRNAKNSLILSQVKRDTGVIDYSRLKAIQTGIGKLKILIGQFDSIDLKNKALDKQAEALLTLNMSKLNDYKAELEEYKICPICLSPITDTERIMKEVRKRYALDPAV